jgi:replicative DNA helicase
MSVPSAINQRPDDAARTLPSSRHAEASLLGSMIVDYRCISDVLAQVHREDFYYQEHQILFGTIQRLYDRNQAAGVDGSLVRDELDRAGEMEAIGGIEHLKAIVETVPSSANFQYYRDIVIRTATYRAWIAGRPGMGKTAAANTIVEATSLRKNPIAAAFFSLEMGQSQISRRLLSLQSGLPVTFMRRGKVLPQEFRELLGIAEKMGTKPLYVRDGGRFRSAATLQAEAYGLHREQGIKIVFIDYLGLMYWPTKTDRWDIEIGYITGSLKMLSKDIGIPVVLLSQVNRKNQDRADQRPRLSDLRLGQY